LGALALIDVTDAEAPVLRSELQLPAMAVSSVFLDGGQIYFAGLMANSAGIGVGRISIQGFEWQNDLKIQTLDMSAVSALTVQGERVWILDRSQGQLVGLHKKDWTVSSQLSVMGLSQLGSDASSLWAVKDTQVLQLDGELHVKAAFAIGGTAQASGAPGPIRVGQETVMTALGDGGVRAFCRADQKALFHVPPVIRAELDPLFTQTQDAALSYGLLVTANANAGLYLYSVSTENKGGNCKERTLQVEGYLDLGKGFRAETLNWQQDVLSVGDGQGRLNLFFIDRDSLESDDTDFDS
jgi:hypothetical protein